MDLDIKRKERKALNSSLYSLTHRNARTIKLVSLRVRRIGIRFYFGRGRRARTLGTRFWRIQVPSVFMRI